MRILFCNYEYPPLGGGGGVLNAHLAEELAQRHDVTVLTSRALGTAKRDTLGGVEVIRVPVLGRNQAAAASIASMASYLPMGAIRGLSLVKERCFDIINTHFVVPTGPLGAVLAAYAKVPNVLTVHGGDLYDPSKASSPHRHGLLRLAIRNLLRRASVVVGQSRNTIDNVHQYYLPDFGCELIPLGIRRPTPQSIDRAQLGFSSDEFLMVTVGRLVARKAVNQLIDIVHGLRHQPLRLIVIGDGPLQSDLERQARDKGLSDNVTFSGFVTDEKKSNFLAVSDLYVSTSQHEGFGLVFLEAMAAGLPVVCYDFGGQTDFLEDTVTGSLIPLNNKEKFSDACKKYMASTTARVAAGEENRKRVESYFIDNCARRYELLFERVVEQGVG